MSEIKEKLRKVLSENDSAYNEMALDTVVDFIDSNYVSDHYYLDVVEKQCKAEEEVSVLRKENDDLKFKLGLSDQSVEFYKMFATSSKK